MAIKPFSELVSLDLSGSTSKKPIYKRDKSTGEYKEVGKLDYLNWADCLALLYANGAGRVLFGNVRSSADHPVFLLGGNIPFVRVYVDVDGDRRELDYPVIDGSNDVTMDKLRQSDVHNATQRGFVKCVAINWGLGLSLWQREEKEEAKSKEQSENLEFHSIWAIKTRIEKYITAKLQGGMSMDDILSCMNMSDAQYKTVMTRYFNGIAEVEKRLGAL